MDDRSLSRMLLLSGASCTLAQGAGLLVQRSVVYLVLLLLGVSMLIAGTVLHQRTRDQAGYATGRQLRKLVASLEQLRADKGRVRGIPPLLARSPQTSDSHVNRLLYIHGEGDKSLPEWLLALPGASVLELCAEVPGCSPNHILGCYMFGGARHPLLGSQPLAEVDQVVLRGALSRPVQPRLVLDGVPRLWDRLDATTQRAAEESSDPLVHTMARHCVLLDERARRKLHEMHDVLVRVALLTGEQEEAYYAGIAALGPEEVSLDALEGLLYQAVPGAEAVTSNTA